LAMIIKQRAGAGKIAKMDLVGSVEGKDCIIVDDMIDTAGTLCKAAEELKGFGAKKVYAFATHGVFTNPAPERIKNSALEKVLITNTIPLSEEFIKTVPKDKYVQLSIGTFIAEVIRRIYLKESVSGMYGPLNYRS
jgi:ribose-phosphate pyrophosphokinase